MSRPEYDIEKLYQILKQLETEGNTFIKWTHLKNNSFKIEMKDANSKQYTGIYNIESGNVVREDKKS